MQKRNILNSPRLLELKKRRRRVFQNKILLSLLATLAVFASLAYLSRLPGLNIDGVKIVGNKVTDTSLIEMSIKRELAGRYLWIFPRTNILIYPKKTIIKKLSSEFKRLDDIDLAVENTRSLEVSVSERSGLYVWCGNSLPEPENPTGDPQCYFLDKDGYIFDEAPYFSGEVYFKFYGLVNGKSGVAGNYFLDGNFTKLISFIKMLEDVELKPVALYAEDSGDIRVFLSARGLPVQAGVTRSPEIIFKNTTDFEKVAENLQLAIGTEPLKSNLKNKYSSLRYIDLRYGNKVYFKFDE